jgi:hypothetical protein
MNHRKKRGENAGQIQLSKKKRETIIKQALIAHKQALIWHNQNWANKSRFIGCVDENEQAIGALAKLCLRKAKIGGLNACALSRREILAGRIT